MAITADNQIVEIGTLVLVEGPETRNPLGPQPDGLGGYIDDDPYLLGIITALFEYSFNKFSITIDTRNVRYGFQYSDTGWNNIRVLARDLTKETAHGAIDAFNDALRLTPRKS